MPQFESVALPTRMPLVVSVGNRDNTTNKDAKLVNCYVETDSEGEDVWIFNRPGITHASQPSGGAATGMGCFFWQGDVYSVFSSNLYRNGSLIGAVDGSNGVYQFSSILGATPKLVFGNGTQAYAYDTTGGLTATLHSINVEYPATTVKGFAYLNGALYVMQPQAVIWGSAINSVSVVGDWDPLDFISAQIEPDGGIALNKQLVYVIAFNAWTTEMFYDAGNATGSTLASMQAQVLNYGCASADSVQGIDDKLLWLTTNKSSSMQVGMMQGLNFSVVSTKEIDRLLEGADASTVYSWQLKTKGHNFYVLTLKNENLTMAFDIIENRWYQWTDTNGNYFPIVSATYDSNGRHVLQHESDGYLYYCDPSYYTDNGSLIVSDIYTPGFDGGTRRRKQLNFMEFIADQVSGSELLVRCSDDDYQTWSNFRRVNLAHKRPNLPNCGTFVRRALHLRHKSPTPFRIQAIELQYDIGTL